MEIRRITDTFAVSPQIRPEDVAAIADAGFTRIICNRPDAEVEGDELASEIQTACAKAGLSFHVIAVGHSGLTEDTVAQQREAIDTADGPVLAYCRSGTRSCHVWALGRAGDMSVDDIIAAAAKGGYDLTPMRGTLSALATARNG